MTVEELYLKELERIKKLAKRYARMFYVDYDDLFQEGNLALIETYRNYAFKTSDEALLKISHRMINRRMYKYAKEEYRRNHTECNE